MVCRYSDLIEQIECRTMRQDKRRYVGAVVSVIKGVRKSPRRWPQVFVERTPCQVTREDGAVAIGSMHGTFGVARDLPTNLRAADVLRERLSDELLRRRLWSARRGAAA